MNMTINTQSNRIFKAVDDFNLFVTPQEDGSFDGSGEDKWDSIYQAPIFDTSNVPVSDFSRTLSTRNHPQRITVGGR